MPFCPHTSPYLRSRHIWTGRKSRFSRINEIQWGSHFQMWKLRWLASFNVKMVLRQNILVNNFDLWTTNENSSCQLKLSTSKYPSLRAQNTTNEAPVFQLPMTKIWAKSVHYQKSYNDLKNMGSNLTSPIPQNWWNIDHGFGTTQRSSRQ